LAAAGLSRRGEARKHLQSDLPWASITPSRSRDETSKDQPVTGIDSHPRFHGKISDRQLRAPTRSVGNRRMRFPRLDNHVVHARDAVRVKCSGCTGVSHGAAGIFCKRCNREFCAKCIPQPMRNEFAAVSLRPDSPGIYMNCELCCIMGQGCDGSQIFGPAMMSNFDLSICARCHWVSDRWSDVDVQL
jgi:hypothetical protein